MKLFIYLATLLTISTSANVSRTLRLNNGVEVPLVGLGTGGHKTGGPPQDELLMQMIADAIDVDYRHIDTASTYRNEEAIGKAVNLAISAGKISRQDMFITSKIGIFNSSQDSLAAVELSLKKLNTSYVDLMLIHHPSEDEKDNANTYAGLEEALSKGLVRAIGVSNYNITSLVQLLKTAKVVPAMNQVESHPQLNQKELLDFCTKHGIHVTAYSPLGAGTLLKDPTITGIGKKHNKTSAQVMVRWEVQRGVVAIPKSTKRQYIAENIDVFDFELTDQEMTTLQDMK